MSEPDVPDVELFSQTYCRPCRQVEAFLNERGVRFTSRNVDDDPEALRILIERGFMMTPVLRIGDAWVAGFKRREIEKLLGG